MRHHRIFIPAKAQVPGANFSLLLAVIVQGSFVRNRNSGDITSGTTTEVVA